MASQCPNGGAGLRKTGLLRLPKARRWCSRCHWRPRGGATAVPTFSRSTRPAESWTIRKAYAGATRRLFKECRFGFRMCRQNGTAANTGASSHASETRTSGRAAGNAQVQGWDIAQRLKARAGGDQSEASCGDRNASSRLESQTERALTWHGNLIDASAR